VGLVTRRLAIVFGVIAACAGCTFPFAGAISKNVLAVRVSGSVLVDGQGRPIRLLGVNRSGTEYACISDLGLFAGPTNKGAIAAMTSWRINAVRLPLNEDCWLSINGAPARFSGAPYQAAIRAYVARLHKAGLYVVLDLHWSAPGGAQARGQQLMADHDHAPAFWSSVARQFRSDPAVMFDLYNEPHDISWQCWRDGCFLPDGWATAGMQTLVDVVRTAGARQPIVATGLGSGNDLSAWLDYRPHDPANQLVAGFHAYNSLGCVTPACWNTYLQPVARRFPLITGELGEAGCSHTFSDSFMRWADSTGVSYLAWTWNPFGCGAPALISSWDGQPTAYGEGLRAHLISIKSARSVSELAERKAALG
jgi:hypothetical protein